MSKKVRCAVCGDRSAMNVRLKWRRDSDGKVFNICCACAEAGRVNAESVNNYQTEDTVAEMIESPVAETSGPRTQSQYFRENSSIAQSLRNGRIRKRSADR